MERCEICAGKINSSIFRGTKVCCEICRKIRQRLYTKEVALREIKNSGMSTFRKGKANVYVNRHFKEVSNA